MVVRTTYRAPWSFYHLEPSEIKSSSAYCTRTAFEIYFVQGYSKTLNIYCFSVKIIIAESNLEHLFLGKADIFAVSYTAIVSENVRFPTGFRSQKFVRKILNFDGNSVFSDAQGGAFCKGSENGVFRKHFPRAEESAKQTACCTAASWYFSGTTLDPAYECGGNIVFRAQQNCRD